MNYINPKIAQLLLLQPNAAAGVVVSVVVVGEIMP